MSIGIEGNSGGLELPRLVNADAPRVRQQQHGLVDVSPAKLAAVANGHMQRHDALGNAAQPVLAAPTNIAALGKTAPETVAGMGALSTQMSLAQSEVVADMHDMLAHEHVVEAAVGSRAERANRFSFGSDRSFDVMLALGIAMQKDAQSNIEMEGKLAMLAREAMMNAARQDRRIGNVQLTGAVSGGVFQAAMSVAGASRQMKGLNTKSMSIQNELKPQTELRKFQGGQSRGVTGSAIDPAESAQVGVARGTGETVRHEPGRRGDGSSRDHQEGDALDGAAYRQYQIDMHGVRHERNQIEASRQQARGELINTSGHIVKSQVDGVSAMQVGSERAEQKEAESAQRVATAVANARRDAAHRYRDAVQKAIEAAKGQLSNANAVAAAVAGNLRA